MPEARVGNLQSAAINERATRYGNLPTASRDTAQRGEAAIRGARTALSASLLDTGYFARTKLSALRANRPSSRRSLAILIDCQSALRRRGGSW